MTSAFTYYPTIPQANDKIATSQSQLLSNAGYINNQLQVDHAWNDNALAGEAAGSHQTISMPNQAAALSDPLDTGIAAQMYCLGGNLFTWNGTNTYPVSAIVTYINGFVFPASSSSFAAIITLPSNCTGYMIISQNSSSPNSAGIYGFFTQNGVLTPPITGGYTASANFSFGRIGLSLQGRNNSNATFTTNLKIIYWPV